MWPSTWSTIKLGVYRNDFEFWRVTLMDAGGVSLTGGRLKRIARYVQDEEAFCFSYGEGLSSIEISKEIAFRR